MQLFRFLHLLVTTSVVLAGPPPAPSTPGRSRTSLNAGWKFQRFTSTPDSLSYSTLKPWMLPSANDFFINGGKNSLPSGTPPTAQYAQTSFNDGGWTSVDAPHDWAIAGPFNAPGISAGMGRLPTNGVGWYRKNFTVDAGDVDGSRSVFVDFDGAMSYAAVWLNGNWVGGWPYGYTSFRLDLTPYLKAGSNLLAVRLTNEVDQSRWYTGAGIYRNLWLVKTDKVHVAQYGHFISYPAVSSSSATVNLQTQIENKGNASRSVDLVTNIYVVDTAGAVDTSTSVATITTKGVSIGAGAKVAINGSTTITKPRLWMPKPAGTPNLYAAITTVSNSGGVNGTATAIDTYVTKFGIRSITYSGNNGLSVNGQRIYVQGTCNHHDQGSIGTAVNWRATERQLQILQDMGSNALRTSHNPPAPEFLELADSMGFLVLDEAFDAWGQAKRNNDYHLLYPDWQEADMRALVRRDRNHPSVIAWSIGNEVNEQSTSLAGTEATDLRSITYSEDPTRQVTSALNSALSNSALAGVIDIEGLNYQGEYGQYGTFHSAFPNKMIWGTEISASISTRGTYLFPVPASNSVTYGASGAADGSHYYVTAYDLATAGFGASPDGVFASDDNYPFIAGGFVWSGFDYLGEPVPYDGSSGGARSSYFGIVDLAGFPKDRYYIYQARWRPDLPVVHLLPHWTWPDRVGQTTPVHVFSSADSVELFLNGVSQGKVNRASKSTYRFRWDNIKYTAGNITAVGTKNGAQWGVDTRLTAGAAAKVNVTVDRASIAADGLDIAYITASVVDSAGIVVPRANNSLTFSVTGPGALISTDNGDPSDYTVFPSPTRKAFSGLALGVVKATGKGSFVVSVSGGGLAAGSVQVVGT